MCRHIEVSLLVPKGARYLHRVSPEIEIHEYCANNSRRNPLLLFELYRYLKKSSPDLVHTHFSKATQIFLPLNRRLQLPHVATKHNPRKGSVYERTPHVIAVSNIVRNSIHRGTPEVIRNGITPLPITARNKRPAIFTMVAVGRLDPIKGFDQLLRDLAPLELDFRLKIIGDGSQREELCRLIAELGLSEKVELCGLGRIFRSSWLQPILFSYRHRVRVAGSRTGDAVLRQHAPLHPGRHHPRNTAC